MGKEAPFTIPESAYGPLRDLIEIKAEDFDAFMSGLTSAEPSISTASLSRHIARKAQSLPKSVISAIVSEIMTMEYVKQDTGMSAEEFAGAISASALEAASDDFDFDAESAKILSARLSQIFSSDHILELNTKAIAILTDHQNLFLNAKILTDARPVFNDDGSRIEAFAIVHMLSIHYERNSDHRDFFVALDEGDIPKLRDVLDRADRKATVLRAALKSTAVSCLEMEPLDDDR